MSLPLLGAIVLSWVSASDSLQRRESRDRAMQRGELDPAVLLRTRPLDGRIHDLLARRAAEVGDWETARARATIATRRLPGAIDGWLLLAAAQHAQGDGDAADAAIATALERLHDIPSDALLLELAAHPGVIGVKYAVNDIDAFQRVVRDDEGRIDWFCGSAERYAPYFMLAGATGYTSGAGNICPHLTLAMFEACQSGDWAQALRLQQIIRPIEDYRGRAGSSYNVSFLKYAARHVGLNFGPPRPPQRTPELHLRPQDREKAFVVPRLLYEVAGASPHRLDRDVDRAPGGHHDHG